MRFSLGGTEIKITPGAVLFSAFCIAAGETEALLLAAVSLAVHEAAHAIAARNLGIPVARLTVYPFGAVMRLDTLFLSGQGERIVSAAGPIASLTFAALLMLSKAFLPDGVQIERLIGTNLVIAILNLLPAYPLDGGRIFRSFLQRTARERTARTLLLLFTALTASGMVGAGIWLFLHGVYAWTLFVIPPFLMASAFAEWRMPDAGTVSRVMQRKASIRSGTAEKAQIVVISEDASVKEALASFSGSKFTILRVLRSSGFTELTETEILDAAAKFGACASLKSVILRLTDGK